MTFSYYTVADHMEGLVRALKGAGVPDKPARVSAAFTLRMFEKRKGSEVHLKPTELAAIIASALIANEECEDCGLPVTGPPREVCCDAPGHHGCNTPENHKP